MNDTNFNLSEEFKKPYVKTTLAISIIIILVMLLTQSYWMNFGINIIYDKISISEIEDKNQEIFILDGYYKENQIYNSSNFFQFAYIVNNTNCKLKEGNISILAIREQSRDIGFVSATRDMILNPQRITILKVLDGCK